MKRVLFHYSRFATGGAEMSSLRMMSALADRGWDVTLVLTTGGGDLEYAIDPRVRVHRLRPRGFGDRFIAARGVRERLGALPDLLLYLGTRAIGALRQLPFLFRRYDAAAVLLHSIDSRFVRRGVRARQRLHWIRNDLNGVDPCGALRQRLATVDGEIDAYVCVSRAARGSLVSALPGSSRKAHLLHNLLDPTAMRARGLEGGDPFPQREDGETRILTVGRILDRDKAVFRIVRVSRALVDRGHHFRWFLVGSGPDEDELRRRISAAELDGVIIPCGASRNPFPWYCHTDLVAMVSNHEGLSGMINEAKVSGASVFAASVSGVEEQIINGQNGWIVENTEPAILEGLAQLLSDPARITQTRNLDFPPALLDDAAKLDRLEALFLAGAAGD